MSDYQAGRKGPTGGALGTGLGLGGGLQAGGLGAGKLMHRLIVYIYSRAECHAV